MRRSIVLRLITASVLSAVALFLAGCGRMHAHMDSNKENKTEQYAAKDETHETYQLSPKARVSVRGINGSLDIETTNGREAEVHVVRSAHLSEDLERRKIIVEYKPESLVIRTDNDDNRGFLGVFGRRIDVRQQVVLKLPHDIALKTGGINGPVNIGYINGPVDVSGINGRVEVANANGQSRLTGINGEVKATIGGVGEDGVRVGGINGPVEIRLNAGLNADLVVGGINGDLKSDIPEASVDDSPGRKSIKARLGAGGPRITVSGINGNVRLALSSKQE